MVTDVTYENIIAISAISKLYLVPLLGLTSCHFLCIICGFVTACTPLRLQILRQIS